MATPSTKNRTFVTATLSETIAVSVTDEPETVEPFAGVMKANGVSSLAIVDSTKTVTRIVELPGTFLILPTTASENESGPVYSAFEVYRNPDPCNVT